jgi:hypothetical protein
MVKLKKFLRTLKGRIIAYRQAGKLVKMAGFYSRRYAGRQVGMLSDCMDGRQSGRQISDRQERRQVGRHAKDKR